MKKILATLLFIFLVVNTANAGTFKADAKTKRIPAGTIFQLEFLQPVSTFSSFEGDSFIATLQNDQSNGTNVILPAGSVVRGTISRVSSAKRFSRGARLLLDFDHVVTPTGRQIPLDLSVSSFDKIYYDGSLYKNLGYGEAVKTNYEKGKDITIRAAKYGMKAGESAPGIQYMTTPLCAIGGFLGGVGYFAGDSVADMFKKGEEVYINSGDILSVKLLNPIDVPVY